MSNDEILDAIRSKVERNSDNSIHFYQVKPNCSKSNVALVQCFYGTDKSRISAVKKSLDFLLKSDPLPANWTFVEAQTTESNASFKWLASKGVNYKFIKLKDYTNKYVKGQLWDIGTESVLSDNSISKIAYLDADVTFCQSNWLNNVDSALDKNQVISPFSWWYYADQGNLADWHLQQSFGCAFQQGHPEYGFTGFAIAMTRDFYVSKLKKFGRCSAPYDDVMWWAKIVGDSYVRTKKFPYKGLIDTNGIVSKGEASYCENVLCHVYHGPTSDRNKVDEVIRLSRYSDKAFSEFQDAPDASGVFNLKPEYVKYCNGEVIQTSPVTSASANEIWYDDKNDISLVQCFMGNKIDDIMHTTKCIQEIVQSKYPPSNWVFVEAQTNKSNAVFGWLKEYGIKYVFKKLTAANQGLSLKHALWKIGAESAKTGKIVFVDSGVKLQVGAFSKMSNALDQYDVISPWKSISVNGSNLTSLGNTIVASGEIDFSGCRDFGIGIRRDVLKSNIDLLDSLFDNELDIWVKICGAWPFGFHRNYDGLPVTVGYADCCAEVLGEVDCSIDTTCKRKILTAAFSRYPDAIDNSGLPAWSKTCADALLLKNAVELIYGKSDFEYDVETEVNIALLNSIEKTYGDVNDDHPLIVLCGFKPNFKMKSIDAIYEKKTQLELNCSVPFTFVCFTDDPGNADELGIDVIPFSSKEVRDDPRRWKDEIKREDVEIKEMYNRIFLNVC